jgi:hypothetical protein
LPSVSMMISGQPASRWTLPSADNAQA